MTVTSLVASEDFQNYCLSPTGESVDYWETQLTQHPEYLPVFDEAKALVLSLNMELSDKEVAEAFLDFKQVVDKKQKNGETKLRALSKKQPPRSKRRTIIAVAATTLFLLSISIWQFFLQPTTATIQLVSNYGEVKTHLLPDGSKVILNANSTLIFKEHWGNDEQRMVELDGEAFFEVRKKSAKSQFIVQTNKGSVQVLGTSFNVKQRAEAFEVALLEGAVTLSTPKYPIIKMEPGELVKIEGLDYFNSSFADVDAFSAWRFQRMVFKEMMIEEVIQKLQDEFNWSVKVTDKVLLKRKITATISKNDPELLLKALSEIYDLEIERLGDKSYLIQ